MERRWFPRWCKFRCCEIGAPKMKATQMPTPTVLAECDGWTLLHRFFADRDGWRSLKLTRSVRGRGRIKCNWWFGWNGERLGRNTDARHLSEHHPAIAEWLKAECQKRF